MINKKIVLILLITSVLCQYCPPSDVVVETNVTHVKTTCKSKNQTLFEGIPISSFYNTKLLEGLLKGAFDNLAEGFLEKKERDDSNLFGDFPKIYHNIYEPYQNQVFTKFGNPPGWNEVTYLPGNPWNGAALINIGKPVENNDNGILVNIPKGYNLVWLRIHNQFYYNFKVIRPSDKIILGTYGSGLRRLNSLAPDGSLSDRTHGEHVWIPMPTFGLEKLIIAGHVTTPGDIWISGLAFTKNPYDFITNSGNAYSLAVNGGNPVSLNDNWNNDVISFVLKGETKTLRVPIIPTKRNKLVYLVEQNDSWTYNLAEVIILSSGRKTRFKHTYQNSFQTHFDGKIWNRFAAFELYADEVPDDNFLDILIVNRFSASAFHFRELGTFNYYRKNGD